MNLPFALIFASGVIMLVLAEPPSSDREQQRLTPQYGEIVSSLRFSVMDLVDQKSENMPSKNLSSFLSMQQLFRVPNRNVKCSMNSASESKREPDSASQKIEARSRFDKFGREKGKINGISTNDKVSTNMYVHKIEALNEVPDMVIRDMTQNKIVTEWLLQDIQRGNHLLLVDKLGFESNKSAETLLQLLNRPTEYIKLHRDTTIQSLTVQPTFKDDIVTYEDSPLVKAVKYGYVLVIGEVDKAPIKVTSSLDTLMEYGEMVLSDGRRIIPKEIMNSSGSKSASFIHVHKKFRMIVMARRTGFPFLEKKFSASLVFKIGGIGTIVKAVGTSPSVTTAVMGGYGTGPHTATAICSGSAIAHAKAWTYGYGVSTATAIASGSSVASAIAYSYDAGVATATATTSGSASVKAHAVARGYQVITDTQTRS